MEIDRRVSWDGLWKRAYLGGVKSSTGHRLDTQPICIGLLSDSHGEVARTRRAVDLLVARGANCLVHCGDFEDPRCLDALAGLNAHICFGNCDNPADFEGYAQALGIVAHHPTGHITLGAATIAFMHGDDSEAFDLEIARGVPWLFHGHTHDATDRVEQKTRVVNPGALYRATRFSVALVTPARGSVEFLPVER